jgi:hypothetical protein
MHFFQSNLHEIENYIASRDGQYQDRRGIILKEANPMPGVFHNIDPPPPSLAGECVLPPAIGAEGYTLHSVAGEGVGGL